MTCTCDQPLSVAWALHGEVWETDGRFYCSRRCAENAAGGDPGRVTRR